MRRTTRTSARTRRSPGTLTMRPLDPSPSSQLRSSRGDPISDAELAHAWVTHPKSAHWLMLGARLVDIEREYMAIAASEHHHAFVGLHDGEPAFLMERYDPRYIELVGLYEPEPGDVGMNFLVAPTDQPVHGFSQAVLTTVMEHLFADPRTHRVVVEPDVIDLAVHRLHEEVGFVPAYEIDKPEKRALLSFCTREQFEAAMVRRAVAARQTTLTNPLA
ncbi:GNAT family N-acetyltransferase [Streptomyces lasiicapitis]|uniref:GNAT family N-acetyltransferase n=1 Tax=Streptomyces lasiicapitis TaxID=1923961 RepID=UPI00365D418D